MRLISNNGSLYGVVKIQEALNIAASQGLDLVEINPKADISVCKVLNYSKFKYNNSKKKQLLKKQKKILETKEIRLKYNIQENDLMNKFSKVRAFIANKHKVKVSVIFRGREKEHTSIGHEVLTNFRDKCLKYFNNLETNIVNETNGRNITLSIVPKNV